VNPKPYPPNPKQVLALRPAPIQALMHGYAGAPLPPTFFFFFFFTLKHRVE